MRTFLILTLAGSAYLYAQDKLSLHEAVQLANKQNKSFEASRAAVNVAASTVQEARAGMRPKLDYSESLTRSNNPVFVFGSLLTQHQFTQANFGIYALNRPGFLDNRSWSGSASGSVKHGECGESPHARKRRPVGATEPSDSY